MKNGSEHGFGETMNKPTLPNWGKKLNNGPTDGITRVSFSPTNPIQLLCSSWDGTCRVYDVSNNVLCNNFHQKEQAVALLDACYSNNGKSIFTAGIDYKVNHFDLNSGSFVSVLGTHEKPVRCVISVPNHSNLVLSGSWDEHIKMWDTRMPGHCLASNHLSKKVFSMDVTPDGSKFIVGTNERQVFIYNLAHTLRNLENTASQAKEAKKQEFKLLQHRVSALKYQTRCIRCSPDNQGYVLASIEGRVAVEYIDPSEEVQKKKYAFKCHRSTENGVEILYPVNAITFHPIHGTFATGGGDGIVNIWDGINKKRIVQYPKYPFSIASLSFNLDGALLAVASSYTFERGELASPTSDEIYIKNIQENDVIPKDNYK
jgi:cell cycle arrest protein BUB3